MHCSIRKATGSDYEAVESLFCEIRMFHQKARRDIFNEPVRPVIAKTEYERIVSGDNSVILMAEENGEPAGVLYSVIEELPPESDMRRPKFLKIRDLYVSESHRRKGTGRALLEGAYEWGRTLGVSHAVLFVWTFNENAIGFYERMGYRKDTIIMARNLD